MTTHFAHAGPARPSIYDVASAAGVSHMTVSRVINGSASVSDATRERVVSAIERLRYTPSSIARALANRRADRLGVLVDDPVQLGPSSTLRALEAAARRIGYTIASFTADGGNPILENADARHLMAQDVEALCIIAPREPSLARLAGLSRMSVPTIAVKSFPQPGMHTVGVDQRGGARLAVEHLLRLGHRSIAHLAGPSDWCDARERETGWREAVESAGLIPAICAAGDWTAESGFAFATRRDLEGVTAVFVANDQMALGVLHGLQVRGLRVPDDISVVGFDDIPDAAHFIPPLTTVRQDFRELGELALQAAIGALAEHGSPTHRLISPELVIRSSTSVKRTLARR